ncbi:MAG: type II secretion system F family protein [Patescibacteria group bacterium]
MPKKAKKKIILDFDISIGGVNLTQKAILARHLSIMLKAGLTLSEALEISLEQAAGKLKKVLAGVYTSIQSGQSLTNSLARYPKVFSEMFVSIVRAGEISGTLEENLTNIADQLEKERELNSKIKGAMLYPMVVSIAAFGLGLAMAFLVLPKITPLFEGLKIDLPFTTRALIWFSHLIEEQGLILFLGLTGFFIFMFWLVKKKFSRPVTHWFFLHLPIIKKITRYSNLSRFCGSLGIQLKSGLNIDEAMEIAKTTLGNYYYQQSLNKISLTVSKGTKLSEQLAYYDKLYPKLTTRMIKVGEETGKLDETLLFLAHFYEVEVDNSTKSLSTAIEPVLLIIIGLVVGFLALSIITPIYEITGNVQR